VSGSLKAVFDCNVFLQALANPDGPAGRCVELALTKKVELFISQHVLEEIRDVTSRPKLIAKFKLRSERVAALLKSLPESATLVIDIPDIWKYDRDPDDGHYVNLALMAGAQLIVSRDKDLLDLMNDSNEAGKLLLAEYPFFRVLTPPQFIQVVDVYL
jgi:putative PIN family toxin of toxin-antitoxin system